MHLPQSHEIFRIYSAQFHRSRQVFGGLRSFASGPQHFGHAPLGSFVIGALPERIYKERLGICIFALLQQIGTAPRRIAGRGKYSGVARP
jgi:hypothetical protein